MGSRRATAAPCCEGSGRGSTALSKIRFPFPLGKGLGVRFFGNVNPPMTHGSKITRVQSIQADKLSFAKRLRREMTPAERILWKALRRNAIDGFHFRRQQIIEGYVVDFYCDEAKLAIELDGGVHEEQWKYDESRDRTISLAGVRVLRISNEAMLDSEAVVEYIRQALRKDQEPNPYPLPAREGEPDRRRGLPARTKFVNRQPDPPITRQSTSLS